MRLLTKESGNVELFFSLIIFMLLIWGLGQTYLTLQHKDRVERAMWTYAVSRAHKASKPEADELARQVFSESSISGGYEKENLHFNESRTCLREIVSVFPGIASEDIPYTFRLALPLGNCGHTAHVRGLIQRNQNLDNWLAKLPLIKPIAFAQQALEEPQGVNKTEAFIPGDDLREMYWTKQLLWIEGEVRNELLPVPLDFIGAKELFDVFTAGVGSFATGPAMDLAKSTGLQDQILKGVSEKLGIPLTGGDLMKQMEDKLYETANEQFGDLLDQYTNQIPSTEED